MKTMKAIIFALLFLLTPIAGIRVSAQGIESARPDTVYPIVEKLQSEVSLLNRLKISGYMQTQFQLADTAGIESFAGGNFPAGIDNRFAVRRGRFKMTYEYALSKFVIQVDVTEKGVGIKDANLSITDPWLQCFSLTAGVFDRPFGYEISYSSSLRESPERSRMYQTLFPGERDLGARLTFQPAKTSRFNFLKIDAGLFNGSGPNVVDFDRFKDFIGHVSINKTNSSENVKIGLGASYYNGGWRQGTKYNYSMSEPILPGGTAMAFAVDSLINMTGSKLRREYYGADAQLSFVTPLGITQLRGEYIAGTQPGLLKSSASPTTQPTTDAYVRKFDGAYFYWVQNIFQTKNQVVVKYDWYDPNTAVAGNEIGATVTGGSKPTGASDIKYSTLGFGWIYKWNSQVKITAYYDYVMNETTTNIQDASTLKDLSANRHDNVFTLRLQYKF